MSEETKLALSPNELELVCNKDWILTKQEIIRKVYTLFGQISIDMQRKIAGRKGMVSPPGHIGNPKISRGENYRGLPYVMLDYPRLFRKEYTLAIRTLFWWGNFFSINLHLEGHCKQQAKPAMVAGFNRLQQSGYWLCVHQDPWQHYFEEDNYIPLAALSSSRFEAAVEGREFIKIGKYIPLHQWEEAIELLPRYFDELLEILPFNFQGDGTGPLPGIPTVGFDL